MREEPMLMLVSEPLAGDFKGSCPCCGAEIIAKCGKIKVHSWAQKIKENCDHWWENETQGHRDCKKIPVEWQEVVHIAEDGEKHIADLK